MSSSVIAERPQTLDMAYARLALDIGGCSCQAGGCGWYHAPWSVLHALGLANTPDRQVAFYREAFEKAFRQEVPRRRDILISGTGNHSMLAMVAANLPNGGGEHRFTVVDLCETPLRLNRAYGERHGLQVRTHASDILSFDDAPSDSAGFDLIVTHAFLGYFDEAARSSLFRRWQSLLAPGGRMVTVQRLRPTSRGEPVRFDAAQQAAFIASALAKAELADDALGLSRQRLHAMAKAYAENFVVLPVRSIDEIVEPLERAGLRVTALVLRGPTPASRDGSGNGPSIAGNADFACIVARKPLR